MKRFLIGLGVFTLASCGMNVINDPQKEQDEIQNDIENDTDSIIGSGDIDVEDTGTETEEDEEVGEETGQEPVLITDFSQTGPYDVSVESRTASVTDCASMSYDIYSPSGPVDPPVVILGHGFARGSGVMVGWAVHFASWGVEVLLPTLCHYNIFFGVDHEMNGQNMKELGDIHGSIETIYAGHSAGGLAAIIAASLDDNPMGVLGLDVTDTQGVPGVRDFIGRDYAVSVGCPAFSIIGEASSCNGENNGLTLFRMMSDYRSVQITSADHCDFENPTDSVCEMNCENSTTLFGDDEIRTAITKLGTAAIMSLSGLSEDGDIFWDTGVDTWIDIGLLQEYE